MNRRLGTRLAVLALSGLLGLLGVGARSAAAESLARLKSRTTDEIIARDLARMDALGSQLAAASTADAWRSAKAVALLAAARQEYQENDRTGFDVAAFEAADSLAGQIARGATIVTSANLPARAMLRGSTQVRTDLWATLDSLGRNDHFSCAAAPLARAEVQLLWAGNEQIDQGDCHASPHVAEAERLLLEARRLLASCARSAVAAPPSVTQPRPRPTPKQVPGTPTTEELSIPKNVHFALNQHALGETSRRVIAGVVSVLEKYPSLTLRLEGHTDSRASAAYNLALSKRRVAAVRAEMIALGIDPARIQAAYLGKSSLKAVEDSAINLARNRRVEMVFIDSGGMVIHAVDQEQDLQLEGGAEHKK